MFLRRRRTPRRGQALVETAIILPILLLLLVVAVDFGRVFFGWVALNGAARVGADYAAQWSSAWEGMAAEEQNKRDRYVALIEADIRTINCDLDGATPPEPTFVDGPDADPGVFADGDYAVVDLKCSFSLVTPLAESLFGGPIPLTSHEKFPIHRAILQAVPSAPVLPGCPVGEADVPDLEGETMEDALGLWVGAGFDEENFEPEVISSGPPAGRNNTKIVLTQSLEKYECQLETATMTVTHSS